MKNLVIEIPENLENLASLIQIFLVAGYVTYVFCLSMSKSPKGQKLYLGISVAIAIVASIGIYLFKGIPIEYTFPLGMVMMILIITPFLIFHARARSRRKFLYEQNHQEKATGESHWEKGKK